jgi:hypothetical protein
MKMKKWLIILAYFIVVAIILAKIRVVDKRPTSDMRLNELTGITEEMTTCEPKALSPDDMGDIYLWLDWIPRMKRHEDSTVTILKISCPGDTDFEPTVRMDVTWALHPERETVAVNVAPCMEAESIINQGKVRVK